MIWNPIAEDYSKGVIIYDSVTGIEYPESEIYDLPQEIRGRLCTKAKVIGCWVYTSEESREIVNRQD